MLHFLDFGIHMENIALMSRTLESVWNTQVSGLGGSDGLAQVQEVVYACVALPWDAHTFVFVKTS